MIKVYLNDNPEGIQVNDLRNYKDGYDAPIWLDFISPSDEEFEKLTDQFDFLQDDIKHYRSNQKRSGLNIHKSFIYFSIHSFEDDLTNYKPHKIAFVLSPKKLVTIRSEKNVFDQVIPIIKKENLLEEGVEFLLCKLLNKIIIGYDHLVEDLDARVEKMNNSVEDEKNILPTIKKIRQDASKLFNLIHPVVRGVKLLGTEDFQYTTDQTKPYFAMLSDHLDELIGEINEMRNSLNETIEAYTAIQSNEMSKVMQVLTILSTVFLPATLIASVYGMNFKIPEYNWKYGYPYSITLMVVVALGFILYMKRRGWF